MRMATSTGWRMTGFMCKTRATGSRVGSGRLNRRHVRYLRHSGERRNPARPPLWIPAFAGMTTFLRIAVPAYFTPQASPPNPTCAASPCFLPATSSPACANRPACSSSTCTSAARLAACYGRFRQLERRLSAPSTSRHVPMAGCGCSTPAPAIAASGRSTRSSTGCHCMIMRPRAKPSPISPCRSRPNRQ